MKNTKRKGFTIVELVIVIAVIAILAAVLIPTFASLINKANRSADIQAVHQMNTQLAIDEVDSNKTIVDVYAALKEGGMTAKDYHPLASDTYFFWVETLNRIVYTDKEYKVTFPEEYEGKKVDTVAGDKAYLSLSGEIEEKRPDISGNTATVGSAENLYWLSNNFDKENITEIKLSNDINLMGANVAFVVKSGKSLTISADSAVTLTGLVSLDSKFTDPKVGKDYAAGLVAKLESGTADKNGNVTAKAEITIKNVTLEKATVGDLEVGSVGAFIGQVGNYATVTLENCSVLDSTINGKNKVAALIGATGSATTTIKGCKVEGCTVNCSEGESAKVIGSIYNGATLSLDEEFSKWVKDTTLNLVEGDHHRDVKVGNVTVGDDTDADEWDGGCEKIVRVLGDDNEPEMGKEVNGGASELPRYRMFNGDAYMTILQNSDKNSVKVGENDLDGNFTASDCSTNPTTGYVDKKRFDNELISINLLYFVK